MKKFWVLLYCLIPSVVALQAAPAGGEKRMFTVTGYYSPLPNQAFYVTGSYEGDVHLNGQGKAGADGTPVFPGMIAAPSTYAFGTKVCLPNFGCGAVHDRGGAIVEKGERNLAKHDRLDLWLGYGEEGLSRALQLGVYHTEGTIYSSSRDDVVLGVNFKAAAPIAKLLDLPSIREYADNLARGDKGEAVKVLQEDLYSLGLYNGEITGIFDESLQSAVLDFQLKNLVIENQNSAGAGRFGPQTREALSKVIYDFEVQARALERWGKFSFDENFSRGKRSAAVWRLQEVLIQEELLDHKPTGYFGKLTESALIEFQVKHGIVVSQYHAGAGNVGPATREELNVVLDQKQNYFALEEQALALENARKDKLRFIAGKSSYLIAKK